MSLGFWEIVLIAIIVLVFFGPSRLPGLGKSIGEAMRGFKEGLSEKPQANQQATEKLEGAPKGESVNAAQKEKDKV